MSVRLTYPFYKEINYTYIGINKEFIIIIIVVVYFVLFCMNVNYKIEILN